MWFRWVYYVFRFKKCILKIYMDGLVVIPYRYETITQREHFWIKFSAINKLQSIWTLQNLYYIKRRDEYCTQIAIISRLTVLLECWFRFKYSHRSHDANNHFVKYFRSFQKFRDTEKCIYKKTIIAILIFKLNLLLHYKRRCLCSFTA